MISKWNNETIIMELKEIIEKINHFPTQSELTNLDRYDLLHAINKNGGTNKFRELLGHKIIKASNGYWTDETIIEALREIKSDIGYIPIYGELRKIYPSLISRIDTHGGLVKFRQLLNEELIYNPKGYWNDETIIKELKTLKDKIGHFPTRMELESSTSYKRLNYAIMRNGGSNKFRKILSDEFIKLPNGYWTDETIIEQLKEIENNIGHFPTSVYLQNTNKYDLLCAINKNGGINKFRKLLNIKITKKDKGYWTDNIILTELKEIISELGYFPITSDLENRFDLLVAISRHGGMNKFRELLGEKIICHTPGYWNDEKIIEKLKELINKIGHFPTESELRYLKEFGLSRAINNRGGYLKFRKMLGYNISLYQQYRSNLMSYTRKRGKKTEDIIKNILQDYCNQNGYPPPTYNKKLATGNIIEFVCNINKKIGIDVTNTKGCGNSTIRNKYVHKDYYKYLDELWIVVFSNVYTNEDYIKFNENASNFLIERNENPNKIWIMSIDKFLVELDYSIDLHLKNKIDAYKQCTFRTREEFINELNGNKNESKQITFQ